MEQSITRRDDDLSAVILVSGGLQQYLIRQNASTACKQPRKGAGSVVTTINDLPDCLHLLIFSFLAVDDLCRLCRVCHHWYAVSCDDILWKQTLHRDINRWNVIGHTTNPDMYNQNADLVFKEIYLRCSPDVATRARQQNAGFQRLSDLLRSFWPKKTPKLAMFGPGLESSTSLLVRKILEGQTELFTAVRMFPGQFGGVGSGFTLKTGNDSMLDLITLYTAPQAEREHRNAEQRAANSRLMVSNAEFELQPAVKELCKTLDGLVYVADATLSAEEVAASRLELFAMTSGDCLPPINPVVILSCVPQAVSSHLPCIEIVRHLQLQQLARPWQVHNCVVDNMDGVEMAFHWLVQSCCRK